MGCAVLWCWESDFITYTPPLLQYPIREVAGATALGVRDLTVGYDSTKPPSYKPVSPVCVCMCGCLCVDVLFCCMCVHTCLCVDVLFCRMCVHTCLYVYVVCVCSCTYVCAFNSMCACPSPFLQDLPSDPSCQMITYTMSNNSVFTLRTSGTEPKIKYYVDVWSTPGSR